MLPLPKQKTIPVAQAIPTTGAPASAHHHAPHRSRFRCCCCSAPPPTRTERCRCQAAAPNVATNTCRLCSVRNRISHCLSTVVASLSQLEDSVRPRHTQSLGWQRTRSRVVIAKVERSLTHSSNARLWRWAAAGPAPAGTTTPRRAAAAAVTAAAAAAWSWPIPPPTAATTWHGHA
jgi:hypothetical protein